MIILVARLFEVQRVLHRHHAELDQVRRRALHGGVDGRALGAGAARAVGAVDFGQVQAAAEHGFHIALALAWARVSSM
jgi:hypothetical protein